MNQKQLVAERIMKNYRYAESVKRLIASQKSEEQRLLLLHYLLHFNVNHIMGRYSDEWIENELIQLSHEHVHYIPRREAQQGAILHVMTKAAAIGGHTALVNNWIEFDRSRSYSVVLTDMECSDVPDFLVRSVQNSGGRIYALHGDVYHKAEELLRISEAYEKVVLNIHMYDIVPILAYSTPKWQRPVYFYNHGNFLFSIGVSISDCYLTLCDYDTCKARRYRGANSVVTLQMPMKVIGSVSAKDSDHMLQSEARAQLQSQYHFAQGDSIIISMGDDYKYKKIAGYDFATFVVRLLARLPEQYRFYIIGADPESDRWKEMSRKTGGRAQAIGRCSREEVTKWMMSAKAYVTSFPMSSAGRQEAEHNHVPVFTLAVTNRVKTVDKHHKKYDIIEDMIEDMVRVMEQGQSLSKSKYTTRDNYNYYPDLWNAHLDAIFNQELQHKIHLFQNTTLISKEEIVNEQLLEGEKYPFQEQDRISIVNRFRLNLRRRFLLDD